MDLVKTKTLADALGMSRKGLLEKARADRWAYVERGKELLWVENRLPTDVRFALSVAKNACPVPVPAQSPDGTESEGSGNQDGNAFMTASDKSQDSATWRASLIYEYERSKLRMADFCEAYNVAREYPALYAKLGHVSGTTLYRWYKQWKESGASGLVPKYGMKRGGAGESLTDEERELLRTFWLRNTKPSAMHAYRLMRENLPWSRCTYQTALRYLNSIPPMVAGYAREGAGRFENMFLPYMEQDMTKYRSLDVVVSDHHCVDCIVMYRGKMVRPWLTTFQDLRSGKVLGWCPCVKPSSISIAAAYYMCCIRWGIPKSLLFDNGKDYRGKWLNGHTEKAKVLTPEGIDEETEAEFRGMFRIVGSDVHFTRTYNGKSKARQERYFRIIGEYLAKDIGTYTGSDSRSRPDDAQLMFRSINGMAQRGGIPEWEDFVTAAGYMIEKINDEFECATNGGKTRSQTFMENLPPPDEIRHPTPELLQKALMKGEIRKASRNGVKIDGIWFWSEGLAAYYGSDIRVYTSLATPQIVTCCTIKGEYICTARANYFKETGNLDADIQRLTDARKKLTLLAEQGSSEVQPAPEYKTMIDAAQGMYGKADELSGVDRFLTFGMDEEEEPEMRKACGAENETRRANKQKSTLKNPLCADASEYAQEE